MWKIGDKIELHMDDSQVISGKVTCVSRKTIVVEGVSDKPVEFIFPINLLTKLVEDV